MHFFSFISGTAPPSPDQGAHFWSIPEASRFRKCLSHAESEHWKAIANPGAALRYASAQGGLRAILSAYLGCPPENVVMKRGPFGKPYVDGAPEFNLSHSAGKICAVFSAQPVGLDVESLSRRVRAMPLAEKFFSRGERAHLASLEEARRAPAFLRYWVCKEAIVKLSGDGIYQGLRDAAVDWDGETPRGSYRGKSVWLREFSPAEGMTGALAAWNPCEAKCFFEI